MKIKIVKTPRGDAPEWVRKEWVGLILETADNLPRVSFQIGVSDGKPQNPGGYTVKSMEAIEELRKKNPKAAKWWDENFDIKKMPWLVFGKDVCAVLMPMEE